MDPKTMRPSTPSVFSQRLMLWSWPLVWLGSRRALEMEDLPALPANTRAPLVAEEMVKLWDAELQQKNPSFFRVLWQLNRFHIVIGLLSSVVHGIITAGLRPLLLRHIIGNIENIGLTDVLLLSVILVSEALLQTWNKQFLNEMPASRTIAACASLISKRIPKASTSQATSKATPPTELTLVSVDLVKTVENTHMLYMLFTGVTQLFTAVVVLLYVVGLPSFFGLAVCLATVIIGANISKYNKRMDKNILQQTDLRVGLLKQMLDGVRFIKVNVWEEFYLSKSTSIRRIETAYQRRFRTSEMMGATCGRITPPLACLLTFCCMAFSGETMKAQDIFTVLSVFLTLRMPLGILQGGSVALLSVHNSMKRISQALMQPIVAVQGDPDDPQLVVSLREVELQWSAEGPPVLQNMFAGIKWGQSVAVVGAVASGKTTLLTSIIGALTPTKGSVCRSLNCLGVGYIPQRPVIFSGTVLSNVIMGHAQDDTQLYTALEAAQFSRDLELMPGGLNTEIGERGTTLSGGQQMRLNVARALYHKPQLLVADDPLAAVDIHVAAMIFQALQSWQKGRDTLEASTICDIDAPATSAGRSRTLVMSLNQLHLLNDFDEILYLQGGRVAFQGSPTELDAAKKDQPDLSALIKSSNVAATCDSVSPSDAHDSPPPSVSPVDLRLTVNSMTTKPQKKVSARSSTMSNGKLIKDEHRVRGSMSNSVFFQYVRAVGGPLVTSYFLCLTLAYGLMAANDWYLAGWVGELGKGSDDDSTKYGGAAIYAGLTVSHGLGMFAANVVSGLAGAHASRHLHKISLSRLLHAPVSWFEETPSGRIISKFSTDLTGVDLKLPTFMDHLFQVSSALLVLSVSIVVIVPWFAIFVVLCIPFYFKLDAMINKSSREIKRMTNMALSPVLTLVAEASMSRALLRVMQQEDWLHHQTVHRLDEFSSLLFHSASIITFLRMIGSLLGALVSIFVVSAFWAMPSLAASAPGGKQSTGLAVAYSFNIPYFISFISLFANQIRLFLAGLERLLEIQSERMPQENAWRCEGDPDKLWPSNGTIVFKGATLRYRPELPPAVINLSLTIKGGERLGVVGRTGAGKSSLSVLLLRIVETDSGSIWIDGKDICQIGLHALRSAVAVVPQEPFLFQGPLSQNLDPTGIYRAEDLPNAMSRVGLPMSLDADVGQGGGQLSAGERQLIAIARATLSTARIVIMDEPTANCDAETDDRLQHVTREAFQSRTLLCIAHRLNTILEYDRVLVMEAGTLAEVDSPGNLMKKPGGIFAHMVSQMHKAAGA